MNNEVAAEIREFLSGNDDMLKDKYNNSDGGELEGHCYVATEAMYQYLGGRESEYQPCQVRHEGVSHWFLRCPNGSIIDLTKSQFDSEPPYEEGRARGMQNTPSSRCQTVLEHLRNNGFEVS